MEQCPKCGKYMTFNVGYFCGNPQIYYTCSCGYDERNNQTTIWTNFTDDRVVGCPSFSYVTNNCIEKIK